MYKTLIMTLACALSAHALAQSDSGDGEIRKVDRDGKRVIIRHGDWKGGHMSAMTMALPVAEGVSLAGVRVGDKVNFEVRKQGEDWVLVRIQPQAR